MAGEQSPMPKSLRDCARWVRLAGVPSLLMHPDYGGQAEIRQRPFLLWMHGRTAHKELDNSRYLRMIRAGMACVAIDLPGHGERSEPHMQTSERSMEVIEGMVNALPGMRDALAAHPGFDLERAAIGGMSLGGMVALARLCRPHIFKAALVEATTGDWTHLPSALHDPVRADAMEPTRHLDRWQPTPLLALHAELDEWIKIEWQRGFIERLRGVNAPASTELVVYPRTGAPHEHIGFGSYAPQAKDAGVQFLASHLLRPDEQPEG